MKPGSDIDLGALNGINGLKISTDTIGYNTGISVSGAGDVNGDGFDDVIIGSPIEEPVGSAEGVSYVVFGFDNAAQVTHQGFGAADSLTGTSGADVMIGGLAGDTIVGAGGADVLRGGAGNDVLAIGDKNFQRIDGGGGTNTLRFDGFLELNLTTIANNKITGIEAIDMTGAANNTLTLGLQDILDLSDTSNSLRIDGNTGDAVVVSDGTWTQGTDQVINSVTYQVYTLGASTLLIDNALYGTTTIS